MFIECYEQENRFILLTIVILQCVHSAEAEDCGAVVPLAVITVILAIVCVILVGIILWGYSRHSRGFKHRSIRRPRSQSAPKDTEMFFNNLAMTGSAGNSAQGSPTNSRPHQGTTGGVRSYPAGRPSNPTPRVPGTSRPGGGLAYTGSSRY